ncbi:MAG TPA: SDR family oxidoreductase [Bacteroidota bacterium]|jgi:putative NADH-flavin reductase|nr:SDR family oxidoreductase [Bacteroidota bacterium]
MNILIIGATGGTGRELTKQALEQGHHVTAFARKPSRVTIAHENLTVVGGSVTDYRTIDGAVKGKDAVLSALGHKKWIVKTSILSRGTQNIITAMEKHGVPRLICETSIGVGNSRGRLGLYYTLLVIPFIIYFYFKDKELQEELIKKSSLVWTIVRPGKLTNGPRRTLYRHGLAIGSKISTVRISRASVAEFMLKQLTDTSYIRKTPGVAY